MRPSSRILSPFIIISFPLHSVSAPCFFFFFFFFSFLDNPSCPVKITSSITMHLSTLAALAAAFASVAYAIPAEAAEAATEATEGTEATEATKDIQHYYARYIANVATGTNLDLYKGESCPKDGKPVPVNGWYVSPISLP
jgi:hypothetical protein